MVGGIDTTTRLGVALSDYGARATTPSPVNQMMASFAADFRDGVDINLGVGYVNEKTIPQDGIVDALRTVSRTPEAYRQTWNYGGSQGSAALTGALRRFILRRSPELTEEVLSDRAIIVGACGASSLLDAIADVVQPGIVITSDPMYYIYTDALARKGFQLLPVPEQNGSVDVDGVAEAVAALGDDAARVSFFYFVNVNNPSCAILGNDARRDLVELVTGFSREQRRAVPLVIDRAYDLLAHDPDLPAIESALPHDPDGLVYEIGTLSKILAPSLRVGYLVGARGPFMDALVQRACDMGLCGSVTNQDVAAWWLDHGIDEQIAGVNAGYREKAKVVGEALREKIGEHIETCAGGRAGFYYYLTLRDVATHPGSPLFRFLTRTTGEAGVDGGPGNPNPRVVYIPGTYCVHPGGACVASGRRQLRLSYGYEEPETILRALDLIREGVAYARARQGVA